MAVQYPCCIAIESKLQMFIYFKQRNCNGLQRLNICVVYGKLFREIYYGGTTEIKLMGYRFENDK